MRFSLLSLPLLAAAATLAPVAHAQTVTKGTYPTEVIRRPLTLPKNMVQIRAEAMIDLSNRSAFDALSLSPDIHYGVTDDFQLGIEHSKTMGVYSTTTTRPLCIGECAKDKVYDQVAIDGKYSVVRGDFDLAIHGQIGATSLDPFGLAVRGGVLGRYRFSDVFALEFNPGIILGVTNRRDLRTYKGVSSGNREAMHLPVRAVIQATEQLSFFGDLYMVAPFNDFDDIYRFGMNLGGGYAINRQIDVGGELRLPVLIGGDAYRSPISPGLNARELGAFANFRF